MGQRENEDYMVKMESDLKLVHKMGAIQSLLVLDSGSEISSSQCEDRNGISYKITSVYKRRNQKQSYSRSEQVVGS